VDGGGNSLPNTRPPATLRASAAFTKAQRPSRTHRTHHEEFYQVIPDHWNIEQLMKTIFLARRGRIDAGGQAHELNAGA